MTSFTGSQISQELLSAYIDGEVNSQEQRLVEQALAVDPEIAWEVESLRRTVALLADLPAIVLPQSFVLPEATVADVVATRRAAHRQKASQTASSWGDRWQSLLGFLGGGNLLLRNAAGVAVVAFFVLLAGDAFIGGAPTPQATFQPMPAAAPAIAQADVQPEAAEMAVMAEEPATQEMPAAKAMPASQELAQDAEPAAVPATLAFAEEAAEPTQDAAPLIPDEAPMALGADPRTGAGGGGGGDGLGVGGGGEITAPQPQPLQAAPAALAQSAPPAAEIQRVAPAPAEAESANQDMVGAASLSITEMSASPAATVAESTAAESAVADSAPQAATMSEPAADVAAESVAEPVAESVVAEASAQEPAFAPAPAAAAQTAAQSAPQPTGGPFTPLRLAQLGLAVLALLLSGLWVRSR